MGRTWRDGALWRRVVVSHGGVPRVIRLGNCRVLTWPAPLPRDTLLLRLAHAGFPHGKRSRGKSLSSCSCWPRLSEGHSSRLDPAGRASPQGTPLNWPPLAAPLCADSPSSGRLRPRAPPHDLLVIRPTPSLPYRSPLAIDRSRIFSFMNAETMGITFIVWSRPVRDRAARTHGGTRRGPHTGSGPSGKRPNGEGPPTPQGYLKAPQPGNTRVHGQSR